MGIEETLVLIKPDGVAMGFSEQIIERYINAGLRILIDRMVVFSREDARWFYKDHDGKFYFYGLVSAISADPCRVLVLRGESAIKKVRDLNGPTVPSEAPEGTIRRDFRSAGGPFNTVHASDSLQAYDHELAVINRCLSGC